MANKRIKGGKMNGPKHKDGGIKIEVEGGEIIINKSINNAAGKHEDDLLKLNENPDDFRIINKKQYKDKIFGYPIIDAKNRRQ
jgi:hypothetical protein